MKSAGMFQPHNQKPGGFKFQNPKVQQCWGRFTQGNNNVQMKHDLNAIDVDTIQVNQLSNEDKQCCMKEG
jgi:hypothetical protein